MIINHRYPTKVVTTETVCPYHQKHPSKTYAGCTCSASHSLVKKPESEWTDEERRFQAELDKHLMGEP